MLSFKNNLSYFSVDIQEEIETMIELYDEEKCSKKEYSEIIALVKSTLQLWEDRKLELNKDQDLTKII